MDRQAAVATVKDALELENRVKGLKAAFQKLRAETPPQRPAPPVRQEVPRQVPEIVLKTKFRWRYLFIPPFAVWWGGGLLGVLFSAIHIPTSTFSKLVACVGVLWFPFYILYIVIGKDIETKKIKNSPEYLERCRQTELAWQAAQREADAKFVEEERQYNSVTIPKYEKELPAWQENHERQIAEVRQAISDTEDALRALYDTSKIIPSKYRTIPALEYIYDIISSSDYDVKYAIESYDRHRQREIDQARLKAQQEANELAEGQLSAQQEANQIAEKARRDANIAAAISAVQRHNFNKNLKRR